MSVLQYWRFFLDLHPQSWLSWGRICKKQRGILYVVWNKLLRRVRATSRVYLRQKPTLGLGLYRLVWSSDEIVLETNITVAGKDCYCWWWLTEITVDYCWSMCMTWLVTFLDLLLDEWTDAFETLRNMFCFSRWIPLILFI